MDAELPQQVRAMLADRGPARRQALMLEITEESLMGDRDRARAILTQLRDQGIEIAVDDFGTGYSSLAYLRDLPDRRAQAGPVVRACRWAATATRPHWSPRPSPSRTASTCGWSPRAWRAGSTYTELAGYGCDQAQGYYLSPPLPAAELDVWLAERRSVAGLQRLAWG